MQGLRHNCSDDGDDILLGNIGGRMQGDGKVDEFHDVAGGGAPVLIVNFNPADELIYVYAPIWMTGDLTLMEVAMVNGATEESPAAARINFFRFDPTV